MWKFLLNRLGQIFITLFIFLILSYVILDAQPGDITMQYMNPRFTEDQRLALQHRLGLDRPVLERFFAWMGNTLRGDLGDSFAFNKPVMELILERAPRTIFLFLSATILQFLIGYYLGRVLAWNRGTALEYGITILGAVMFTIFTPWFALIMLWLFSYNLKWFPLGKFLDPVLWRKLPADSPITSNSIFNELLLTMTVVAVVVTVLYFVSRKQERRLARLMFWGGTALTVVGAFLIWALNPYGFLAGDILNHLVLPVATLTILNFAGTMLLTRTTMLETLREDYIMAARAKGISERQVRDQHAARNALLPVFTNLIIALPFIMGGGIITETVFSWPGMGLTLLNASNSGDIPVVMGTSLFLGVLSLFAHLISDITYAFLDPRIRFA
ncbi:MAG TPA: ABC transporter permease [Anaerolineaceae bacterium]|nr:ABC transporter permease [Anaerolineaceae bacterium]